MSTQPNPEHVNAGAALRRIDEAKARIRRLESIPATVREIQDAHEAHRVAVAAYYEEGGK